VASQELDLEFWYCWISQADQETEAGWKLHDIRLPEHDTNLNWFSSIEEASIRFRGHQQLKVRPDFHSVFLFLG